MYAYRAGNLSLCIADRGVTALDNNRAPILALALGFPADDGFAGQDALTQAVKLFASVSRHQPSRRFVQGFFCAKAKQLLRAAIPADIFAIKVCAGECVRRSIGRGSKACIFGLDAPPLCDIFERRHNGYRYWTFTRKNRLCVYGKPAQRFAARTNADQHIFLRLSCAYRFANRKTTRRKCFAVLLNGVPCRVVAQCMFYFRCRHAENGFGAGIGRNNVPRIGQHDYALSECKE